MDPKASKLLKPFVQRVKRRFPKARVYLFGSRARKDYRKDSDYDILIISPEFKKIPFAKRLTEIYLLQEEPLPIEVVCLSPQEYEERSSRLTMLNEVKDQALELAA